jgi:argininosuccinate lyase
MKIWQKEGSTVTQQIDAFTVGRDREFDMLLAPYDVKGSIAHVTMLHHVGLLNDEDYSKIKPALEQLYAEILEGCFAIDNSCEDIHSQIEWMLIQRIGEAGKKIHSGRSRNDQVAVDIKLYLKAELQEVKGLALSLFNRLLSLSEQHKDKLMPGYTHMQVAMPSSFGLWFAAYAESLVNDMDMLMTAFRMVDKNPLGSGAGYGSSFALDRQLTTDLLGFSSMHYNSIYAQMSRGKTEKIVAQAISGIAATLSRYSMDVCLYNGQNFGFVSFPSHMTTGSSIMPHKKNPDVFELVRGKCNRLQSIPNELALLMNNLPSGYHREMQLTKEILFPGIETLKSCLSIVQTMLQEIEVHDNLLDDERYRYIFTVEQLNDMVNSGVAFRDAYRQVGMEVENGNFSYSGKQLHHIHAGSIGNLCNDEIRKEMNKIIAG